MSEVKLTIEHYILCLDTDSYAGNFERETTAYATGQIGDCEVGVERSREFFAAVTAADGDMLRELDDKIAKLPDEHGCYRPCAVQYTPGWVNDGSGNEYQQSDEIPPTLEQIEKYRQTRRNQQLPWLKRVRELAAKGASHWTPEALQHEEEKFKAIDNEMPRWFGANNSVGIYLNEPLSESTLKFVIYRAEKFLESQNVKLQDVRLVTVYAGEESKAIEWK